MMRVVFSRYRFVQCTKSRYRPFTTSIVDFRKVAWKFENQISGMVFEASQGVFRTSKKATGGAKC